MSMDLVNSSGSEFCFSTRGWAFYLNLAAILYGWEKAGTQAPRDWDSTKPWQGAYDWNAGQVVTGNDAKSLAQALECYLNDPAGKEKARDMAEDMHRVLGLEIVIDPNDGESIVEFISFAREGAFEIW